MGQIFDTPNFGALEDPSVDNNRRHLKIADARRILDR